MPGNFSRREDPPKAQEIFCVVCGEGGTDFALNDGRMLHSRCVDAVNASRESARNEVSQLTIELNGIAHRLKAIFRGSSDLSRDIRKYEEQALEADNTLRDLWDWWPDYPPDWSERKRLLSINFNGRCEECGASGGLQTHHILPLARGGSNKKDNLELLCIRCHGKEHGQDFESDGFREKLPPKVDDKVEVLKNAIEGCGTVSFMYKKYGDKKGQQRTIHPREFVSVDSYGGTRKTLCVKGHCELRGEDRVFAVKRMWNVR